MPLAPWSMESKSVQRLQEIDAAIRQIANFAQGKAEADYMGDSLLRSAVLWQLVRICEPVRALARDDIDVAQRITGYRDIIGFRTLLIHRYSTVKHDRVWRFIQSDLPTLREDIGALLTSAGA